METNTIFRITIGRSAYATDKGRNPLKMSRKSTFARPKINQYHTNLYDNFIKKTKHSKHFTYLLLALCLAFLQGIESVQVATTSAIQKAFAFILLGMISEHIKASEAPDSIGAIGSRGQATILCEDIRMH